MQPTRHPGTPGEPQRGLLQRGLAGYQRALSRYPAESRFFLFLTAMGAIGLLLQKETLAEGLGYTVFWCSFMVSLLSFWHDDLFTVDDRR
jgi:hypothetical protein